MEKSGSSYLSLLLNSKLQLCSDGFRMCKWYLHEVDGGVFHKECLVKGHPRKPYPCVNPKEDLK